MPRKFWMPVIFFQADDGTGGGAGGEVTPPAETKPDAGTGTVLFPEENTTPPAEDKKPDADPADPSLAGKKETWTEYVNDPTKSDEENAALKAEHDKTNPDHPLNKVPEDGKYAFEMPEGIELDTELADALGPEFKNLNLTQGQASKLVEIYSKVMTERVEKYAATPEGKWSAASHAYFKEHGAPDKWLDAAKADKTIGGANWNTTVLNVERAIKAFGDTDLMRFVNRTGAGNHPSLIKAFAKAGAMLAEDNPAGGNSGGKGVPVEKAYIMFPNDVPKK